LIAAIQINFKAVLGAAACILGVKFMTLMSTITILPTVFHNHNFTNVLGGEVCMWGEMNNEYNVGTKVFP